MKKTKALLIGRFQPFHKGHLYLVEKALENADKVIIAIGSANVRDSKNPFGPMTRRKMIKAVFYKEKIEEKLEKIIFLDDFLDDEKWLDHVKKTAGRFDFVIGNNGWVNGIMKKGGYRILTVPYYQRFYLEGEKIRKLMSENGKWKKRVPSYLISYIEKNFARKYKNVALGGTFDHFHKGHMALIDRAFSIGDKVVIGITHQKMCKDKILSNVIEPYNIRKKSVRDYISSKKWVNRSKLTLINDFAGPLTKDIHYDAVVVSKNSKPNADLINRMRLTNGIRPLEIVQVEEIRDRNNQNMISSAAIRKGTMDRKGNCFIDLFEKTIKIPDKMKTKLRKPLGKIIKGSFDKEADTAAKTILNIVKSKPVVTITVGDIISRSLKNKGFIPNVEITDNRSRRVIISNGSDSDEEKYQNIPGTINRNAVIAINRFVQEALMFKNHRKLVVDGEEDLLALPVIMLSPLGSLVLYGHWQHGVISVAVTEKTKEKVSNMIKNIG